MKSGQERGRKVGPLRAAEEGGRGRQGRGEMGESCDLLGERMRWRWRKEKESTDAWLGGRCPRAEARREGRPGMIPRDPSACMVCRTAFAPSRVYLRPRTYPC
eukprot:155061-Rhodomonas_salina.2